MNVILEIAVRLRNNQWNIFMLSIFRFVKSRSKEKKKLQIMNILICCWQVMRGVTKATNKLSYRVSYLSTVFGPCDESSCYWHQSFRQAIKKARQFVYNGQGLVWCSSWALHRSRVYCHVLTPRREKIKKWIASFSADS